ncbi:SDR family NAD(P)-dependent oxidoreductase [Mucilaginibacter sp. BJC16-A38]|uniref:oxidoreductase n=1 Tax=Mucilaginibacter phenanthrenivorans TaxID=1234842 RepID=UPI00215739FA|nr:oxidoreductase [Mucilaginibacter phenanthrenivorans]MCR8560331.1 SDR family NAD(P)-dependent oxidoreductase [Mucilaginibacter phenanthrenivorans]
MIAKQKTWFITGISSGMGLEIARTVLEHGDNVIGTVRKYAEAAYQALDSAINLHVVVLDVTDEVAIKHGVEEAITRFGKIDVLLNNAGYGYLGAIEEATAAEVRRNFETNVFGVLNVTRAVLPYMRKERAGHIINISSMFSFGPKAGWGIYAATKYAVNGISEGLALELKPFNIKVTSVEPGLFLTHFQGNSTAEKAKVIIDDYERTEVGKKRAELFSDNIKRLGDVKKIGHVIVQLANAEDPPLHLPIGSDSVKAYRDNTLKYWEDVNEWEEISVTTDDPDYFID